MKSSRFRRLENLDSLLNKMATHHFFSSSSEFTRVISIQYAQIQTNEFQDIFSVIVFLFYFSSFRQLTLKWWLLRCSVYWDVSKHFSLQICLICNINTCISVKNNSEDHIYFCHGMLSWFPLVCCFCFWIWEHCWKAPDPSCGHHARLQIVYRFPHSPFRRWPASAVPSCVFRAHQLFVPAVAKPWFCFCLI